MKIPDILRPECVRVPLLAAEKISAITELVDVLEASGQIGNRDVVLQSILAREEARSTATEFGLAVPHGKSEGVSRLVMAVGKPEMPIDFGGDGRYPPSDLLVLLASPIDQTGPHIQALARISRVWLDPAFRAAINAATQADQVFAVFIEHDV